MRAKFLLLFLSVSLGLHLRAEENTIPDYLLHFATLENMVTPKIRMNDVISLRKSHPHRADFIGKFWRQKAWSANEDSLNRIIELAKERLHSADAQGKKTIADQLKEDVGLVLMGYYYDHADEIAAMISYSTKRGVEVERK